MFFWYTFCALVFPKFIIGRRYMRREGRRSLSRDLGFPTLLNPFLVNGNVEIGQAMDIDRTAGKAEVHESTLIQSNL